LEVPFSKVWLESQNTRYLFCSISLLLLCWLRSFLPNFSLLLGFSIRGVSPASISSTRLSVSLAQERILSSSLKRKVDGSCGSKGEEEQEEGSLVRMPRVMRRVISDDKAISPPSSIPSRLLDDPESTTLVISDEEMNIPPCDSTDKLFTRGFDNEAFGPVSEELPLAYLPVSVLVRSQAPLPEVASTAPPVTASTFSTIPVATTSHTEVGPSSSNKAMKKIIIEVPESGNLLKKSGQANVWLKPLLGPVEKAKLESHGSLTWMNDIVHSSLKVRALTLLLLFSLLFSFI